MVTAKLAFVLVQVGSKLWINPMQLQGIESNTGVQCPTIILVSNQNGERCSDWPIDKIREALSPANVSRALEGK